MLADLTLPQPHINLFFIIRLIYIYIYIYIYVCVCVCVCVGFIIRDLNRINCMQKGSNCQRVASLLKFLDWELFTDFSVLYLGCCSHNVSTISGREVTLGLRLQLRDTRLSYEILSDQVNQYISNIKDKKRVKFPKYLFLIWRVTIKTSNVLGNLNL